MLIFLRARDNYLSPFLTKKSELNKTWEGAYGMHQIFDYFWNPWDLIDLPVQVFLVLTKNGRDIGLQSGDHFAGAYSKQQIFAHLWNPWDLMDHPVQVLLSSDQKWPTYRPFKVVLILQVHTVYTKFLPIFGISEICQPLCQIFWIFDKKWQSYRPSEWCLFCWCLLYAPIFCLLLPSLKYAKHCVKFYGILTKIGGVTVL